MDAEQMDAAVSGIAACIGEPARARMLYCLLDGCARTSTELGIVAEVSPSTASAHLARLKDNQLVKVLAQGKHRYYSLKGADVARVLEALSVVAGREGMEFAPATPRRLREARTCYDHMAGETAVTLHDRLQGLGWLQCAAGDEGAYDLTREGVAGMKRLGVDCDALHSLRRRFAYACLDWSERSPHVGGALGAALLTLALRQRWVRRNAQGRGLTVTAAGRREIHLPGAY
jgi:DNA-binding transcriptional ArsR family regulator